MTATSIRSRLSRPCIISRALFDQLREGDDLPLGRRGPGEPPHLLDDAGDTFYPGPRAFDHRIQIVSNVGPVDLVDQLVDLAARSWGSVLLSDSLVES